MSGMTIARDAYYAATRSATDTWLHSRNLPDWQHSYESLKAGPFVHSFSFAWLGEIQLFHEVVGGPGVYRGHSWKGSRVIMSVAGSPLTFNSRVVPVNRLVSFRWDGLDHVTSRRPSMSTAVAFDENWLCDHISELTGTPFRFRGDAGCQLFADNPKLTRSFETEIQQVIGRFVDDPNALQQPGIRSAVRSHVLNSLVQLLAMQGAPSQPPPPPTTRAYVVDRSLEYIHGSISEAISILDLCRVVRVCPRTLCYSFKSVLGISPSRYLLTARLNRVHGDLRSSTADVSIRNIAAHWGFWHMGRFAKYYRETFGQLPSDTTRADATRQRGAFTRHAAAGTPCYGRILHSA